MPINNKRNNTFYIQIIISVKEEVKKKRSFVGMLVKKRLEVW